MAGRITLGPDNSLTLSVGALSQPLNISAGLCMPATSAAETTYAPQADAPYVSVVRQDGRHFSQYEGHYDDLPPGARSHAAMHAIGILPAGSSGLQQPLGLNYLHDGVHGGSVLGGSGLGGSGYMARSAHGDDPDPDFDDGEGSDEGGDDDGSRGSSKRPRAK